MYEENFSFGAGSATALLKPNHSAHMLLTYQVANTYKGSKFKWLHLQQSVLKPVSNKISFGRKESPFNWGQNNKLFPSSAELSTEVMNVK